MPLDQLSGWNPGNDTLERAQKTLTGFQSIWPSRFSCARRTANWESNSRALRKGFVLAMVPALPSIIMQADPLLMGKQCYY